jgi:hypothetical protein
MSLCLNSSSFSIHFQNLEYFKQKMESNIIDTLKFCLYRKRSICVRFICTLRLLSVSGVWITNERKERWEKYIANKLVLSVWYVFLNGYAIDKYLTLLWRALNILMSNIYIYCILYHIIFPYIHNIEINNSQMLYFKIFFMFIRDSA